MKRLSIIGLIIVLYLSSVIDLFAISSKSETLQNAAVANGNGTASSIQDYTTVVIQVAGTFTATVNFEVSTDGTNYTAIQCFSVADKTSVVTTVTVAGAWRCNIIGLAKMRARISGYGSGAVTVRAMYNSAGVF